MSRIKVSFYLILGLFAVAVGLYLLIGIIKSDHKNAIRYIRFAAIAYLLNSIWLIIFWEKIRRLGRRNNR